MGICEQRAPWHCMFTFDGVSVADADLDAMAVEHLEWNLFKLSI